ncbi:MAG: Wzz/FepE/Etk N-terminal domain-containing protein [Campylobacterota bacterium]|nr:Wzz/FepE/Etk N-terminal domain-containing protein [Campylobacterota bacterium]
MQNSNQHIEEDEIDLRELFSTIWRHKLFIAIFSFFVTFSAIVYALSKPNIYESKAIFLPTKSENSNKIIPEGLDGFVTLSIGKNAGVYETYQQLLNSYDFTKGFILKSKIYEKFYNNEDYVYALGLDFFRKDSEKFGPINKNLTQEQEAKLFGIFKTISGNLTISQDKKNNMITFSYKSPNRALNKEVLDKFLDYTGNFLKQREIKNIEDKIANLNNELALLRNIDLKNKMLELIATIYKRKVFLQAEDYSGLQVIVMPEVSYIKEKVAPKRALIVVVAAVTSLILSIFLIFFIEFIRGSKKESEEA